VQCHVCNSWLGVSKTGLEECSEADLEKQDYTCSFCKILEKIEGLSGKMSRLETDISEIKQRLEQNEANRKSFEKLANERMGQIVNNCDASLTLFKQNTKEIKVAASPASKKGGAQKEAGGAKGQGKVEVDRALSAGSPSSGVSKAVTKTTVEEKGQNVKNTKAAVLDNKKGVAQRKNKSGLMTEKKAEGDDDLLLVVLPTVAQKGTESWVMNKLDDDFLRINDGTLGIVAKKNKGRHFNRRNHDREKEK